MIKPFFTPQLVGLIMLVTACFLLVALLMAFPVSVTIFSAIKSLAPSYSLSIIILVLVVKGLNYLIWGEENENF
jgi:hypothetical protein